MDAIIETRNKLYDETVLQLKKTQKQQKDYHTAKKKEPPTLEPGTTVLNKVPGLKSKTRTQYEPVLVTNDRNRTYIERNNRKLHKA